MNASKVAKTPHRILAAIESEDHCGYVIDKVVRLRDCSHGELLFARTHYDGSVDDHALGFTPEERDRLVELETLAEQIKFRRLIGASTADGAWESTVAWSAQAWQGVLDLARQRHCDLIVKDTYICRGMDGTVMHTPHDWDLLHHAEVPVMMLKPGHWATDRVVLAAIDVFDSDKRNLNRHILEHAMALAVLLDARLHLANAVPVSERLAREYGIADYAAWAESIRSARRGRLERLAADIGAEVDAVHVNAGVPWKVISDLITELCPACLVIGRVKASVRWYLDTTSERLLHAVDSDVLSVP